LKIAAMSATRRQTSAKQSRIAKLAGLYSSASTTAGSHAMQYKTTLSSTLAQKHTTQEPRVLAQADDLVGCFQNAPPDLASNPAYMRDFGIDKT
jgi:hypothetical protein